MKYTTSFLSLLACCVLAAGAVGAEEVISGAQTILVCRSKQCTDTRKLMTREFMFNKLGSLLDKNIDQKVLFCEADPYNHVCLYPDIRFNILAGVTPGMMKIPSAKILDAKSIPSRQGFDFVMDYTINVNDTFPECQAVMNQMVVTSQDNISMTTPAFECKLTNNGISVLNMTYNIDYVDLDYGILGATYTVGTAQVSKGGGDGYMLMRFTNPGDGITEADLPVPEPEIIVQEKIVTEYEIAPIEVIVKTKAPIVPGTQTQSFKINGVDVPNVPVVVDQQPIQLPPPPQM